MFQITKVWVDPSDKVDSVEIRFTWSAIGEAPKWQGNDEAEVMSVIPNTTPRVRQAAIEIPRYLDGKDNYLLHYQFGESLLASKGSVLNGMLSTDYYPSVAAASIMRAFPRSIPRKSSRGRFPTSITRDSLPR